jgi:hypothetical protein
MSPSLSGPPVKGWLAIRDLDVIRHIDDHHPRPADVSDAGPGGPERAFDIGCGVAGWRQSPNGPVTPI